MATRKPEVAVQVRGRIERLYYSGPQFSAGRLLTSEGEVVSFAGTVLVQENDPVVLVGQWDTHPKFGRQFKACSIEHDLQLDHEGLIHYLAHHPQVKGIGLAKARRIVESLGDAFEQTLLAEPQRIAQLGGVSLEAVQILSQLWLKNQSINNVMAWLSSFGLTHHQVTTLVDALGNNCLEILKDDPYILIREIRGFGFKVVDQIARKLGTPKNHPARLRAGLVHCVRDCLDSGHCWVEYQDLLGQADLLLVMDTLDSQAVIETSLEQLIEQGVLHCEAMGGRLVLSTPEIFQMERDLSIRLLQANQGPRHFLTEEDREVWIDRHGAMLNEQQRQAVRLALGQCISLVSGGAGSGKSYTIAVIHRLCKELDLEVVLSAPTGKAAKRLEEVSGGDATTIHRLLGYDGKTFARNSSRPIDADVLVVDEFSMVDVPLAWHLFQAIDPLRTSVLLVGDHNQLPPVGPGNILRDLIQTRAVPSVILDKVVRQAGVLKENCTAILQGEVRPSTSPLALGGRSWCVADSFSQTEDAVSFLLKLFEKRQLEEMGFHMVRDVQVLTPTHLGPLGTKELNVHLQRLIQQQLYDVEVVPVAAGRRPALLRHDKVIQTRNNYDLGVMNGSIGYVIDRLANGTVRINFDGVEVEFEKGSPDLRDLQLAYALTIHKTQGSEFPCVVVVIHKAHSFMHHRNLFYTAVTRARTTAIVLGDRWGVHSCAKRCQVDERRTFLSHMLSDRSTRNFE